MLGKSEKVLIATMLFYIVIVLYTLCFCIFQFRNPRANFMMTIREFTNVITFEKMECYQKYYPLTEEEYEKRIDESL